MAFVGNRLLRRAMQMGRHPAVVCFENVPGILERGHGLEMLVESVRNSGYQLGIVLIDAALWLPASRKRVFVVAVRQDVPIPPGMASDGPSDLWHTPALRRAVARMKEANRSDLVWWVLPSVPARTLRLQDVLEVVPENTWFGEAAVRRFTERLEPTQRAKLEAAKASGGTVWGATQEKSHRDKEKVRSEDGELHRRRISTYRPDLAFTLLASATGSSRQKLVVVNGELIHIRDFTPRETARLMGVPDFLAVPDTITGAMEAFGDAVAVPVVRHLARHLFEPLADAARRAADEGRRAGKERVPEDGRRPIKALTKGVMTYLSIEGHHTLKSAAAAASVAITTALQDGLDMWLAAQGVPPLPRYVPAERGDATKGRRTGTRSKTAKGGRRRQGRPMTDQRRRTPPAARAESLADDEVDG